MREMKTFFDVEAQKELEQRLQKLNAQSACLWGRMNAAQMLAHCTAALQMPVGDINVKRTPLSLIGWMFKKSIVHGEKPFSKNSPTAAEFIMNDPKDFDMEKQRFADAFRKASQVSMVTCHNHPFFGKMSNEDWGLLLYKHMDHHLRQFGI